MSALALVWLCLAGPAHAESSPEGSWLLSRGRDAGSGQRYEGRVRVRPRDDAWAVFWSTSIGDFQGSGLVVDTRLWVAWSAEGGHGLAVYRLDGDQLDGVWVADGSSGALGSESAVRASGRGLEGGWRLSGATPEGEVYTGTLLVERTGRTWSFTWVVGETLYRGVGLKKGDTVAVAWGAGGHGVAGYRIGSSRARGVWAAQGYTDRGRERWRREESP